MFRKKLEINKSRSYQYGEGLRRIRRIIVVVKGNSSVSFVHLSCWSLSISVCLVSGFLNHCSEYVLRSSAEILPLVLNSFNSSVNLANCCRCSINAFS